MTVLALILVLAAPPAQTLDDLLHLASEHNGQIAEARMGIEVQVAMLDQANWAWFTPIEATGLFAGPIPEARSIGGNPLVITPASRQGDLDLGRMGILLQAGVKGVIPLYTFGKLSALQSAAEAGVGAATHNVERVRAEVLRNVRLAFYAHSIADEFLSLADDAHATVNDALNKARELFDAHSPQVTQADIFRLRSLRGDLLARRSEAEQGRASSHDALRQLVNASGDFPVASMTLKDPRRSLKPLAVVEPLVAEHRPEAHLVASGVAVHEQLLKLREGSYYPDVFVAGGFHMAYSNAATDQTNPFVNDEYNYIEGGVGMGLRVTLDYPMKLAQVAQARAELGRMETQKTLAETAMLLQLRVAYHAYQADVDALTHHEEAAQAARSWMLTEKIAFDVGTSFAKDLIEAISAWADAQAKVNRNIFELHQDLADLMLASGSSLDAFSVALPAEDEWE